MGVYSLATHSATWIPVAGTPDTYLFRFGWLKDGKTLYTEVLNRAQTRIEVGLADAATGQVRVILTETDPAWIEIGNDLHFSDRGDRFLWGSNRDGWRHLYLYDSGGHLLRQLTHGNWHVEEVSDVDEQHGWVYFIADERSPVTTDLYRVPLNVEGAGSGAAPQRITNEEGSHHVTFSPDHVHYVDDFSALMKPPSLELRAVGRDSAFTIQPSRDLSAYQLETPEFIHVTAADGKTQLPALLLRPAGFNARHKYPVIMFQYGGPGTEEFRTAAVRNAFGGVRFLFDELLANEGFVVFIVDNRAAQYFSFRDQSRIKGHFGRIELEDQVAAARWLKSQPWVDASRVGIWGWSYGGYMTTYELTNAPGVWRAGIAVAPVTEWTDYDTIYTERYMGMPQENAEGYRESSSTTHVDRLQDHLLLVHGTGDDNVHFQNSVQFIEQMIDYGKQFELMIYPRKTHGIAGVAASTHLFTMIEDFWKRELKPGE
jgi:dipeptidyl-peptidase-4